MEFMPPAYVEKVGTHQFPRFVMRDGVGHFWTGTSWSDSPREVAVYYTKADAVAAEHRYADGENHVRDTYTLNSSWLPTGMHGNWKNWSSTWRYSVDFIWRRTMNGAGSSSRCIGMIFAKQNRLWRLVMDLLNLVGSLWKKNDTAAVPTPVASDSCRRPHLSNASNSSPTMSASWHAEWPMGWRFMVAVADLGKTRVVLETLKEEGLKPLVLNGHITPLILYTNLYERPDSILFLDDCDSLFRNFPALGILRWLCGARPTRNGW